MKLISPNLSSRYHEQKSKITLNKPIGYYIAKYKVQTKLTDGEMVQVLRDTKYTAFVISLTTGHKEEVFKSEILFQL